MQGIAEDLAGVLNAAQQCLGIVFCLGKGDMRRNGWDVRGCVSLDYQVLRGGFGFSLMVKAVRKPGPLSSWMILGGALVAIPSLTGTDPMLKFPHIWAMKTSYSTWPGRPYPVNRSSPA